MQGCCIWIWMYIMATALRRPSSHLTGTAQIACMTGYQLVSCQSPITLCTDSHVHSRVFQGSIFFLKAGLQLLLCYNNLLCLCYTRALTLFNPQQLRAVAMPSCYVVVVSCTGHLDISSCLDKFKQLCTADTTDAHDANFSHSCVSCHAHAVNFSRNS